MGKKTVFTVNVVKLRTVKSENSKNSVVESNQFCKCIASLCKICYFPLLQWWRQKINLGCSVFFGVRNFRTFTVISRRTNRCRRNNSCKCLLTLSCYWSKNDIGLLPSPWPSACILIIAWFLIALMQHVQNGKDAGISMANIWVFFFCVSGYWSMWCGGQHC